MFDITTANTEETLSEYLQRPFQLPNDPTALKAYLVNAQHQYEVGKTNEIAAIEHLAAIKEEEGEIWEAAYVAAVGSSQAAKKENAERNPAWLAYEQRKRDAETVKRAAERNHSIAYQRLETLRSAFDKERSIGFEGSYLERLIEAIDQIGKKA